tara:strand:- start:785 stop:967 length:183 start_codon:yes stop_codon:yes gene_type:complete
MACWRELPRHGKRDIEKMLPELQIDSSNLGCIYKDSVGREQIEYRLDRDRDTAKSRKIKA